MADPKIKYEIGAQVSGSEEVRKLAGDLKGLDTSFDPEVAARAAKLREQITQLGQQQAAVQRFQELQAQLQGARDKLSSAQAAFKALHAEVSASEQPTAKQAGQLQKLGEAVGKAKAEVDKSRTALAGARTALGDYGVTASQATKTLGGVSKAEQQAQVATKALAGELGALKTAMQGPAQVAADRDFLGLQAHGKVQKEIEATRAAYDRLKTSGKLSSAEMAQAALKTEDRIRELKSQTNGWTESLQRAKGSFAALAGAGAGVVAVTKAAIDFESAMADVRKVAGGTDQEMAALGSTLKRLASSELPLSAGALAQIAAAGGQLGVPIEKLEQFTRLAATMATAFNISAEEAGSAVAKLANVFAIPIEEVGKLGDAINVLGNTTAAKEKDIVEVLTRVGGAARMFGLTAEQTSALATTFLSLGTSAEVSATGINAMLTKLQTANVQTPEFRSALDSLGVSAVQLAADIQDHPQRALLEFLKTLNQLDAKSRAEILVKLFGLEYQDDIARLLGSLGQYETALKQVGDSAATAGAMGREFGERMKTTQAQIDLLKNSIEVLAATWAARCCPSSGPSSKGWAA